MPEGHAPLDPLRQNVDFLPRAGGGGGGRKLLGFDRLEVLESTAEAVINARAIGAVRAMSEAVISELRDAFDLK